MEKNIKRQAWIDIAKGIAIICTIIGHTVSVGGNVRNYIYSFHMPLFFVLAGYTIRQIPKNEIGKATWKDFKRLLLPLFVIKLCSVILDVIIYNKRIVESVSHLLISIFWGNGGVTTARYQYYLEMCTYMD